MSHEVALTPRVQRHDGVMQLLDKLVLAPEALRENGGFLQDQKGPTNLPGLNSCTPLGLHHVGRLLQVKIGFSALPCLHR